jgi:hypothetical protein
MSDPPVSKCNIACRGRRDAGATRSAGATATAQKHRRAYGPGYLGVSGADLAPEVRPDASAILLTDDRTVLPDFALRSTIMRAAVC